MTPDSLIDTQIDITVLDNKVIPNWSEVGKGKLSISEVADKYGIPIKEYVRSSLLLMREEVKKEIVKKVKKFVSIEPEALIPRTQAHLEAYRNKLETRNEFRQQIKEFLNSLGDT